MWLGLPAEGGRVNAPPPGQWQVSPFELGSESLRVRTDVEPGPDPVWGDGSRGPRGAGLQKQLRKALAKMQRISAA